MDASPDIKGNHRGLMGSWPLSCTHRCCQRWTRDRGGAVLNQPGDRSGDFTQGCAMMLDWRAGRPGLSVENDVASSQQRLERYSLNGRLVDVSTGSPDSRRMRTCCDQRGPAGVISAVTPLIVSCVPNGRDNSARRSRM